MNRTPTKTHLHRHVHPNQTRQPLVFGRTAFTLVDCLLLSPLQLAREREAFDTGSRIARRLLSQRVVQHDAILATLALLRTTAPRQ